MISTRICEQLMARSFSSLGRTVGTNPFTTISLCMMICVVMCIGFIRFEEVNNVRTEYSPLNSPSRKEYAIAKGFLNQNGSLDPSYIMIKATDRGSLLREKHRTRLIEFIRVLRDNVTVVVRGRSYGFRELCEPYCELNTAFLAFLKLYNSSMPSTFTYPQVDMFGTQTFIGNNVYGVTFKNGTHLIESFTTAILPLFLVSSYEDKDVTYVWVLAARKMFSEERFQIFKSEVTGDSLVSSEVRRMGLETAPMIVLSILAMAIIVAAFFLVLSVGVDDVFLMLRAWDRTDVNDEVPKRLALTLEESGPGILISSVTNTMAFIIGMTSQTPAVRSFSLYAALAIAMCFFYQLLMFSAVLAASGYRERKGLQSFLIILAVLMCGYYYANVIGILQLRTVISIEKMSLPDSYLQEFQVQFEASFKLMQPVSVFIMNPGDMRNPRRLRTIKQIIREFENATFSYGSESTFSWIPPYEEFLSFYGETEEFTYKELPVFLQSATYFYMSTFVKYNETACFEDSPECITAFFFVTNFHGHIKYHELIPAVKDWRRIAAKYPDYQIYAYSEHSPFIDQTMAIDATVWGSMATALLCTAVACFVFIPSMACIITACFSVLSVTVGILGLLSLWGVDLDPISMTALLMAVGFSVDFTSHIAYHFYKSKQKVQKLWRIARSASYDTEDGMEILKQQTKPHVNLEDLRGGWVFSVMEILVYYVQRLTMEIFSSFKDPALRIEETLLYIGWPVLQVGLSTIIAILPLALKPSYLVMVFFKTIVTVCSLGMFHGLVVMPAILTAILSISNHCEQ
uniref:SSD domain-containing protein n=1 Tax=Angiostrongylus cantonensis TaxID=6313 RepID=A0A158PAB8_ANGCA